MSFFGPPLATISSGVVVRDAAGAPLVYDQKTGSLASGMDLGTAPALFGDYETPDGRRAKTVMSLAVERDMGDR